MKAMILAAGYGTRLRPITYTTPKPLLPIGGRPLIASLMDALTEAGVTEIVVNVHHFPELIKQYVTQYSYANVHVSYEPQILGTGGGLRKVRSLLEGEEDFFLLNGDTFQRPRFADLQGARRRHDSFSAMTLRHSPPGDRYTAVWVHNGVINGFGKGRGEALMFSGSHCVSSRIFRYIPDRDVSDITGHVYQPLVATGRESIAALIDDDPTWFDIGTPQRYLTACRAMGKMIGKSVIEGDVRDSVVWDDCYIGRGVVLESCIVTDGVELRTPMRLQKAIICRDEPAIPRDPSYRFENGLVIASI